MSESEIKTLQHSLQIWNAPEHSDLEQAYLYRTLLWLEACLDEERVQTARKLMLERDWDSLQHLQAVFKALNCQEWQALYTDVQALSLPAEDAQRLLFWLEQARL